VTIDGRQRAEIDKSSRLGAWLRPVRGPLGPFLALALVVGFFGAADSLQAEGGSFLSQRNARALTARTATVAVAALGMTVVIIAGGIDLSAGTALALCACVLAWSLKSDIGNPVVLKQKFERLLGRSAGGESEGGGETSEQRAETRNSPEPAPEITASRWTPPVGVVLCVLAGCACGLLNGALISYLRVVPFIVTLGTMTVFLGMAKWLSDNTTIRPDKEMQVPEWLANLSSIRTEALWFGFPSGVWLALLLAALLSLALRYTVFSRYVFALGSNEQTARLCGIRVQKTKMAVYALAGFFIGVAGIYQFSRLSVGNATSGVGLELQIIAAVVIGGGSLSGGRGSVLGTLTGAAIMAVIESGCTQLGLDNDVQDMILGIIIIAAVTLDQYRQRRLAS
jgi:ribose transport system permease protein